MYEVVTTHLCEDDREYFRFFYNHVSLTRGLRVRLKKTPDLVIQTHDGKTTPGNCALITR